MVSGYRVGLMISHVNLPLASNYNSAPRYADLFFAANPAAFRRIFLRGTSLSLNSEPLSRDLSAHRSARDRRVRRRGRAAYPVALNVRADDCGPLPPHASGMPSAGL